MWSARNSWVCNFLWRWHYIVSGKRPSLDQGCVDKTRQVMYDRKGQTSETVMLLFLLEEWAAVISIFWADTTGDWLFTVNINTAFNNLYFLL